MKTTRGTKRVNFTSNNNYDKNAKKQALYDIINDKDYKRNDSTQTMHFPIDLINIRVNRLKFLINTPTIIELNEIENKLIKQQL
ncbi:MAG: hypothetical protein KBE91_01540 [Bacteroidia bacterium]|nr:hypothetical protein [Bacteroidia bacterium]